MVQKVTPLVILALLMLGNVSVSDTMASTWNFRIETMTTFAMSENGHYIIVGCEKGPLCEKGQFYVFDQYGNTVKYGCIEGEIAVVDITDNGAFFIGTRNGYYYSSASGKLQENKELGSMMNAVSMSEIGEMVIAGTNKEILIFDRNGIRERKEVSWPVNFTAANVSGDVLVAGITDRIFLYREATNMWVDCPTISQIVGLAVSDDGNTIVCGMSTGRVSILDSQLKIKREVYIPQLTSIAMSGDGNYLVCGTRKGEIFYLDASGDTKWSFNSDNMVKSVLISSDGSLVVAVSTSILLFDSLGRNLRELKSSETVQSVCLSRSGEILSCSSGGKLSFLQLYQESYAWTSEYMLPSRRSIPLEDQLTEVWSYGDTPKNVVAADVNGDGENEIICSFAEEMAVLDSKGKVIWKKSFERMPRIAALDVTGDFVPEILVTLDGYIRFQVFDGEGQELANHEFYSRWRSSPPKDTSIIPLWSGNIDDDSSIEVICVLSASYSLEPRGLYAFEYPSFKEEWYYPVAPPLYPVNFVDINKDGQVEIVAGSNAPCNGRRVGNTDDCHAYVYAVTLQGEELWTKEIGSGYKRVRVAVADVNGDGEQEIVGGGWSFENDWGTLFILDSKGVYVLGGGNEFDHSVFLIGVADLNNDGNGEIVTVSSLSTIGLYDYRLKELKRQSASIALSYNSMAKINDIDGDGEKEIILSSDDTKLLILNANLEEEWNKTFPSYDKYLKSEIGNLNLCKNHLLVLSDRVYAYTYAYNSEWPCVPWVIVKEEKMVEIENALNEARKYHEQKDLVKAREYVSQAEEIYKSMRGEDGFEKYYAQIEEVKKAIETLPTETPVPTTPPTTTPADGWGILEKTAIVCSIAAFILAVSGILYQRIIKKTKQEKIPSEERSTKKAIGKKPPETSFEFDIAISFAGEDREIAENLAEKLGKKKIQNRKVRVFPGESIKSQLWGKELTEYFRKVYGPDSRFVVLLLSKYYPVKKWTDFEFTIMREEAKKRKTEFILPVRLDETEMEGIREDILYLDFQKEGIDGIVDCLLEKLSEPLDQ